MSAVDAPVDHIARAIVEHGTLRDMRRRQLADFLAAGPVSEFGETTVRWHEDEIEYHQAVIDALTGMPS